MPEAMTPLEPTSTGAGAPDTTVFKVAVLLSKFEAAAASSGKTRMVSTVRWSLSPLWYTCAAPGLPP